MIRTNSRDLHMTSKEIRRQFLDFFASRGHAIVPSSPVVPHDDPTLLFTNAGMNQFKDVFLGTGSRGYTRAADTQKCIRAGGKHNDLDDVGTDTYHHTFFEMLGNWSFGDYFKKEAIEWGWELLTEVWGIDKTRLHATYFEGKPDEGLEPDHESRDLWTSITDIDPDHLHPGNMKDNFWEMGDVGPCGPCSEIHIDLTPDKSGGPLVNAGDHRVIEIWNLVFIQFNRGADRALTPLPAKHVDTGMGFERLCAVLQGKSSNYDTDVWAPVFDAIQKRTDAPDYRGTLPNEPRTSVRAESLGAGDATVAESPRGLKPAARSGADSDQAMRDISYRIIADHVRCLTFALTDGAIPSNEGRGYVLRRILRRAVRYGRQYFDMHEPFLCDLVELVVEHMADAFPELRTAHGGKNVEHVTELIRDEEQSFGRTLDRGIAHFQDAYNRAVFGCAGPSRSGSRTGARARSRSGSASGSVEGSVSRSASGVRARSGPAPMISGQDAFKLHDTYGFPIDLTELMAAERGLRVDIGEYERLMEEARELARGAMKLVPSSVASYLCEDETSFVGNDNLSWQTAVEHVLVGESFIGKLRCGACGTLVLEPTPFYAEQGGQVGDTGTIQGVDEPWEFEVSDTQVREGTYYHIGKCVRGTVYSRSPGPGVHVAPGGPTPTFPDDYHNGRARAIVNETRRRPTTQNHTATHMLNWALREVLGDRVQQKGSLVDPEKTRFDFSHNKPLTVEELTRVEALVNEKIDAQLPVYAQDVEQKTAREIDTLRAVFGEKYPDRVRVVSIGARIGEAGQDDPETLLGNPKTPKWMQYAVEFCGGTHLKNSSEAERFVLVSEEAVAKGIRRVVGVTGDAARQAEAMGEKLLAKANAPEPSRDRKGADRQATRQQGNKATREEGGREARGKRQEVGRAVPAASEPSRDRKGAEPSEPSRDREGAVAQSPDDLGAALAALQREIANATIPVRVRHTLRERIAELQERVKQQQKQHAAASGDAVMERMAALLESAETVDGVTIVVGEVPPAGPDALRGAIDWVRNKTDASAVLLAAGGDGKVTLIAGMSKAVVKRGVKAGDLIREVAPLVGGKGGGRPDMAQGGGNDPAKIGDALESARQWVAAKLG